LMMLKKMRDFGEMHDFDDVEENARF